MAKRPLKPAEIARIDIDMSHAAYHHGWWKLERPLTPIAAQMNVGYAVAVAILDGAAMVQQFSPQRINRDDVWAMIEKITAHHDPEFDKSGARHTRMTVTLTDGSKLQHLVEVARTMAKPLTNDEVVKKFRALTDGIVTPQRQADIIDAVLNLDSARDTARLTQLLAPAVEPAFKQ
jgi:2-methylcitrate dehydratase PrpD